MSDDMSEHESTGAPAPYVYRPVDAGATHEREIAREAEPSTPTTAPTSPASGPESNTVPSTAEGEEH